MKRTLTTTLALLLLTGSALAAPPARFAVVIGAGAHSDTKVPAVAHAPADAQRVADWLTTVGGVSRGRVLVLADGGADFLDPTNPPDRAAPTRRNIRLALGTWLQRHVNEGDAVLVYFAGQAAATDGAPLWLPSDATSFDLAGSAVDARWVVKALDALPAADVTVWMDASFAGRGARMSPPEDAGKALKALGTPKRGRWWLAGSTAPAAEHASKPHGAFTAALVAALRQHREAPGKLLPALRSTVKDVHVIGSGTVAALLPSAKKARPQLVLQAAHTGRVFLAAFGPRSRLLATTGEDNTTKLWNVKTRRVVATLDAEAVTPWMRFSPDGSLLAVEGPTGLYVYTASGRRLWHRPVSPAATQKRAAAVGLRGLMAFAPDGSLLAWTPPDGSLELIAPRTGKVVRRMATKGFGTPSFGDGGKLVSRQDGNKGRSVAVFDVATGKRRGRVTLKTDVIDHELSPDGRRLAVRRIAPNAGGDFPLGVLELFDAKTLRPIKPPAPMEVRYFWGFGPLGKVLYACATDDRWGQLWDPATGKLIRRLPEGSAGIPIFSADGKILTTHLADETRRWDVATGKQLAVFKGEATAVSPDATTALASTTDNWGDDLMLRDLTGKKPPVALESPASPIIALAPSPDGERLAVVRDEGTIVWDLKAGKPGRSFQQLRPPKAVPWPGFGPRAEEVSVGAGGAMAIVRFGKATYLGPAATGSDPRDRWHLPEDAVAARLSPDAKQLLTLGPDGAVATWDVVARARAATLAPAPLARPVARPLIVDAAWKRAVRLSDQAVEVLSLPDLKPVATAPRGDVVAAAFAPRGDLWLVTDAGRLRRWAKGAKKPGAGKATKRGAVEGLVAGPGGQIALYGADDQAFRHDVTLVDGASGKILHTLRGHRGAVTDVAFSKDGKLLFTGARDTSLRVWDVATGAELATVAVLGGPEAWAVSTPDGLFDGSREGLRYMEWRVGDTLFALDQFEADFLSPRLLARLVAGQRPHAAVDMDRLRPPPAVRILSPQPGTRAAAGTVEVDVLVTDQGGGVSPLWVYHNGHRLPVSRGAVAVGGEARRVPVELIPGDNHIRVTAFNADGSVEARGDEITVSWDVPAKDKPTLHVLAVGIDSYARPGLNLGFAVADANAVAGAFAPGLFGRIDPVLLTDGDATRAGILAALGKLARTARPRDAVVVYLAGHGTLVGQGFYFLPHEADISSDTAIRETGLSQRELGEALVAIPARKQLVVLDACHSGASAKTLGKLLATRDAVGLVRAQRRLARSAGSFLVAASTAAQLAKEIPELGHGVLTYALLSAIGAGGKAPQARVTGDGAVTVNALLAFLDDAVPRLTERYHGGAQNPVQASTGQDFPIAVVSGP